eukprot:Pgem_evm1s7078
MLNDIPTALDYLFNEYANKSLLAVTLNDNPLVIDALSASLVNYLTGNINAPGTVCLEFVNCCQATAKQYYNIITPFLNYSSSKGSISGPSQCLNPNNQKWIDIMSYSLTICENWMETCDNPYFYVDYTTGDCIDEKAECMN